MATFTSNFVMISTNLIILILIGLFSKNGHALGRRLARGRNNNFHSVHISSIIPSTTSCSGASSVSSRTASLNVVNRHGPCHQPNRENSNKPSLTEVFTADQSRATRIQDRHNAKSKRPNSDVSLPAQSGASFGAGNYIVTVGLGTPKNDFTLIFDTRSSLTWTQCEPCAGSCFKQKDPTYDPASSSTYSNISCSSSQCFELISATGNIPGCLASTCTYEIEYGDGSFSKGLFAEDTLTLSPTDVFEGFHFGCGQNNKGLFGEVAGLIGLGRDPFSMVSQTAQKYGKFFSYCLPTFSGSNGHLTFGNGTVPSSVSFTPFSSSGSDEFYFIDLEGISVGGKNLDISPSAFHSSGTIIDSGTVITRLPNSAYSALRDAFRQQMTQFKAAPPFLFLDTCFDLSNQTTVTVPKISFLFNGNVTVDLDVVGILVVISPSQVCFAFAGNADDTNVGIYGNIQQQKLEVVYDVAGGRLGFGAGGSS